MRFSKVMRILVASAAATVIAASGASAVEISANAVADGAERVSPAVNVRSVVGPTALSLSGRSHVRKGGKVTFKGTLISSASECWGPGMVIELYRRGHFVGTGTTSVKGAYSITVKIKKSATYKAKFAGATWGVHPDDVTCFASTSNKVKVHV